MLKLLFALVVFELGVFSCLGAPPAGHSVPVGTRTDTHNAYYQDLFNHYRNFDPTKVSELKDLMTKFPEEMFYGHRFPDINAAYYTLLHRIGHNGDILDEQFRKLFQRNSLELISNKQYTVSPEDLNQLFLVLSSLSTLHSSTDSLFDFVRVMEAANDHRDYYFDEDMDFIKTLRAKYKHLSHTNTVNLNASLLSFAARLKSRIEKYGIPNSPELLNVDKKWKNVQLYTHLLLLGENIRRSVDANHHKEATLWPQKCLDQNVPCLQEFMNNCAKNKI